jgi:hypothetical protein
MGRGRLTIRLAPRIEGPNHLCGGRPTCDHIVCGLWLPGFPFPFLKRRNGTDMLTGIHPSYLIFGWPDQIKSGRHGLYIFCLVIVLEETKLNYAQRNVLGITIHRTCTHYYLLDENQRIYLQQHIKYSQPDRMCLFVCTCCCIARMHAVHIIIGCSQSCRLIKWRWALAVVGIGPFA